jgi:MiaB-like tRNA modifying enzyme
MKNKKIFAEVYGCSANVADFEIALGLLRRNGYRIVDDAEESDLNIIFTCIVKTPTANRMIHRIRELTKLKKPLIVAGCMSKTERKTVEKINPKASLVGPDSIEMVPEVVRKTLSGKKVVFTKDLRKPKICLPRVRRNHLIDIVPIAIGCLSNCSYCEVKFARGKLFSYPPRMIVEEVKQAIKNGCKELWITSQDNSCYGRDINTNLPELLNEVCKVEGKFFVRVGMMNPMHVKDIIDELIESYRSKKIFKFLHLPVQSGSSRILELMNRGYTVNDFRRIVKKFRKEFPFLTLSTDVIVGFPGEEEKDFQKTVKLIREVKPDIVNVSKFGARPGTKAAEMEQLPRSVIDDRTKRLVRMIDKIKLANNKKWLNWEGEVLIDEKGKKGGMVGRNFAYKPVLTEGRLGTFKRVKIIGIKPTFLVGK